MNENIEAQDAEARPSNPSPATPHEPCSDACARKVPFLLVCLYALGVRLQQALSLAWAKRRVDPAYSACVPQALTLTRIAFERLLAHSNELADWWLRAESILEAAAREWDRHVSLCDGSDEAAEVVVGKVQELLLIADHVAGHFVSRVPEARTWLALGRVIVNVTDDRGTGEEADEEVERLGDLLTKAGVNRGRLLPEVAGRVFRDDCPTRDGDFRPWHAVEVGLNRLLSDAEPENASAFGVGTGTERAVPRPESTPMAEIKPRWDRLKRTLWYGDEECKSYRRAAPNQFDVLDAFQKQGWPDRIDAPFSGSQLAETIKAMREGFRDSPITFAGDGRGRGIVWRPQST